MRRAVFRVRGRTGSDVTVGGGALASDGCGVVVYSGNERGLDGSEGGGHGGRRRRSAGRTCVAVTAAATDNKHSKTLVCVEPPSSALNMTLPALLMSTGACDRYRSIAGTRRPTARRAAANQPHAAAAVDRHDRQSDGRTPDRSHKPCFAYYPGSVNKLLQ